MKLLIACRDDSVRTWYNKKKPNVNETAVNAHYDSGFDVFCPDDCTIPAGAIGFKINLGIRCAAYHRNSRARASGGGRPSPFYLYPRSSLSKTPLRLANSVGIIDSGYRGDIIAVVDNIGTLGFQLEAGRRLFQLCAPNLEHISPVTVVEELEVTQRGTGGFGSTGQFDCR